MDWVDEAKRIALTHAENVKELNRIITESTGDDIQKECLKNRISYLNKIIAAVDHMLSIAKDKLNGEVIIRLWELVYGDKTYKLFEAADALGITRQAAKKYNRYILLMIALRMGYVPSDIENDIHLGTTGLCRM